MLISSLQYKNSGYTAHVSTLHRNVGTNYNCIQQLIRLQPFKKIPVFIGT